MTETAKKKRKNSHRVAMVVSSILIACAVLYGGYKAVLIHRIHHWKAVGIAYANSGDNAMAVGYLQLYLQQVPHDEDALRYYIKSREKVPELYGQHLEETVRALKTLLDLDPDSLDDRRHLLELYYQLNRPPEALDTANDILTKAPNDARALEVKVAVLTRLGRNEEAMDTVAQWTSAAPLQLQPRIMQVQLEHDTGRDPQLILSETDQLRQGHAGDPTFEMVEAFAYAVTGDRNSAVQWLKNVEAHPQLPADLVQPLVNQMISVGMPGDSLAVLQREFSRGNTDLRDELARRQWEAQLWPQTLTTLATLDPADTNADPTLLAIKAMAYFDVKQTTQGENCVSALAARSDPVSQAWALTLQHDHDGKNVSDKDMAAAYRAALGVQPANPYLLAFLGDCCLRQDETDLAINALRGATQIDVTWNAPAVQLVSILLQHGKPADAFEVASRAIHANPTNPELAVSLAMAWSSAVDTGGITQVDDLVSLVNKLHSQMPDEPHIAIINVQLLAVQGKKQEARDAALALIARQPPPDQRTLLSLASESIRYGLGVEQECYSASQKSNGATPDLALTEAQSRFQTTHQDALPLFDALEKQAPNAGDLTWKVARARYLDISSNPGAKAAWVDLGNAYPTNLAVQQAVLTAQCLQGDWDVMQRTIDRVKSLTGDSGLDWRLAGARLLVYHPRNESDTEKAATDLTDLTQRDPQLPEPHVLMAEAMLKLNRPDAAVTQLSAATRLDPTNVSIAMQLAALYQSQGQNDQAKSQLQRVAPLLRTETQRRQAALLLSHQNDADAAIKILAAPAPSGASIADQDESALFLAVLYRQQRQYDQAEQIASQLLTRPTVPAIQFAASLYAQTGRNDLANQALAELDQLKIPPGLKESLLGDHAEEAGNLQDAAADYQTALAKNPGAATVWRFLADCQIGMGKLDDALATIQAGAKANPNDGALSLLVQQTPLLVRALSLDRLRSVTINVVHDPLNSDTNFQLLKIVTDGIAARNNESLATQLQDLITKHPESMEARMQLALCDAGMNRYPDALAAVQGAMDAFPDDPRPTKVGMALAGSQHQWPDVQRMAEALKSRSPADAMEADIAIANSQINRGDAGDAVDLLTPYLSTAKANPKKYAYFFSTYVWGLVGCGRQQEADDLLWPMAKSDSFWRPCWIQTALKLSNAPDDAAWLDRLSEVTPDTDLADRAALASAYDELGRAAKNSDWTGKSASLFRDISQSPNATGDELQAAGLQRDEAGDWKQAQAYYRAALSKDPNLITATNNLAMSMLDHKGEAQEALRLARKATQLNPMMATLYDSLADAQRAAANPQGAVDAETTATQLDPDNLTWEIRLADYMLDAGDRADAARIIGNMDLSGHDTSNLPDRVQAQLAEVRTRLGPAKN